MDADLIRRVRQLRAQNPLHPIGIRSAVQIARYEQSARNYAEHGKYPWLAEGITNGYGEERAEGEIDGLTVVVRTEIDGESMLGDDDVTGTFGDTEQEGAILNTCNGWGNGEGRKWYYPSNYRQHNDDAADPHNGMSRSNVEAYRKWLVEQDMREDYSRDYYGVVVEVYLDGAEIGSSSLWGIDSIDGYDPLPYLYEVAEDQIEEALVDARRWMAKHAVAASTS